MQVKRLGRGVLEVGRGGAGGVELAEQGQGLASHGLFDEGELAHLRGAERLAQPGGFGVDAAAAACLFQQAAELGEGQLRRVGGGGGCGQDGPGLGPHDAVADAGEGGQEGGVVLAQVRAELVVRGGAVGLGQLGVGGQRPVRVQVGAQHVGQDKRVAVVGFLPCHRVPVPVAGHCHRVDGVNLAAGGAQARDQQAARCLDRHRDRVLRGVAVLGQQGQQRGEPGRVVADAAAGQQPPVLVRPGDVMVIFGPVDSAVHVHASFRSPRCGCCSYWSKPCRARTLPNGRAQGHRHPISRS